MDTQITLGKTGIKISSIGFGLMQWGDRKIIAHQENSDDDVVRDIYKLGLDVGINFYDTAELYGNGYSELQLAKCLRYISNEVVVATKFMPYPWRLHKGELKAALQKSLKRLGRDHVDLYQMHWPFPPVPVSTWMDAMAEVMSDGLVRAVGVSNYSPAQTQLAFDSLAKYNIPLASNQVKFNLLDQKPIHRGLVDLCKKLGVTIIAYSPLEKGILTGKYTTERTPRGLLSWHYNKSFMLKIAPLFRIMEEIGHEHEEATPGQVALNWLISKGAVPIPGARTLQQAKENAGTLLWKLIDEEVNRLDKTYQDVFASG
jgi:aryl-alcohol dehydrogenase-like predicted oxidoreductase